MIRILYGNTFLVHAALKRIQRDLRLDEDIAGSNVISLEGAELTPSELVGLAQTVPFLAEHRLVIVNGLLAHLSKEPRGRRGKKAAEDDPLTPWRSAAAEIAASMPEGTTLLLVEETKSAAFSLFEKAATVEALAGVENLASWIGDAAESLDLDITARAMAWLAEVIGPNLWMLDNELRKLAAWGNGARVDLAEAQRLVSASKEFRYYELSSAVAAGDERKAMSMLQAMLDDGAAAPMLAAIIASEYRKMAVVKEMKAQGARDDDIAKALGMQKSGSIRFVAERASRYGWDQLREAYALMVEADLAVKRGLQDDDSSLQLLVHELCALARSSRPAQAGRAYVRATG